MTMLIIAIVSVVWMVVWKFAVLDTVPDRVKDTCPLPVKGWIALILGGPIVWIVALCLALVFHLKNLSVKYWGEQE